MKTIGENYDMAEKTANADFNGCAHARMDGLSLSRNFNNHKKALICDVQHHEEFDNTNT